MKKQLLLFSGSVQVHCQWSDWSKWGECSKACGGGARYKHRYENVKAKCGGKQCEGKSVISEACNVNPCHVPMVTNCQWSAWTKYGECTNSCTGNACCQEWRRTKTYATLPVEPPVAQTLQGTKCEGNSTIHEACNTCPIPCQWSEWKNGGCVVNPGQTCGTGIRYWTR